MKNNKVLLIEDDESNYIFYTYLFKTLNVDIIYAENGKISIDLFKENINEISFVMLDIRLPDINGFDLIKIFKDLKKEIPIVVCSAMSFGEDISLAKELGAEKYLVKPIRIKDIKEIINEYQAQNQ